MNNLIIMFRKISFGVLLILLIIRTAHAEEGMIVPTLIRAFESDMQAMGMKLTAEEIYSVNNSSLKDAILHFGGGCTAELVSKEGLLLTNHHCGYSQIQSHSSLENDYLKNGFWAKNKEQELPNKGLTASRIVRIQDVTKEVLFGILPNMSKGDSIEVLEDNMRKIKKEAVNGTHYSCEIKPFNYGNDFYLIVQETFSDVRLVGTPPNSIGKFGGDTDNWVWPRHTGDFAVFRVYADVNNSPAEYSTTNIPYQPLHFFKISLKDRKYGDFTMVYGFPGETQQHVFSEYLRFIMEKERPARIQMRRTILNIIDKEMLQSDEVRIKYASKQARIANAYKKWIGQIDGLRRLDAVNVKKQREIEYQKRANSNPHWQKKYGTIIEQLNDLAKKYAELDFQYAMFYEYHLVGTEFLKLGHNLQTLTYQTANDTNKAKTFKQKYIDEALDWFKNYDANVDKQVFIAQSKLYYEQLPQYKLEKYTEKNNYKADEIFQKSILVDKDKYWNFVNDCTPKTVAKMRKQLEKDPGFIYFTKARNTILDSFYSDWFHTMLQMDELLKIYVQGKYEMFPEEKQWADANGTLRITYGKLEGSQPRDGVQYIEHTTLDGVIDKYYTNEPDFEISPRLLELHKNKEYGSYSQNGDLWVCFTGSNHTTGGNSGSPVIDAHGNLMGINFDRSWESTMSDYLFDPTRCRNIAVDIRYVLWVIDIYSGAKHIVEEMDLVY